jgi:hypothetical protein
MVGACHTWRKSAPRACRLRSCAALKEAGRIGARRGNSVSALGSSRNRVRVHRAIPALGFQGLVAEALDLPPPLSQRGLVIALGLLDGWLGGRQRCRSDRFRRRSIHASALDQILARAVAARPRNLLKKPISKSHFLSQSFLQSRISVGESVPATPYTALRRPFGAPARPLRMALPQLRNSE